MNKEFDALVFIGRFQPFHNGHKAIVEKALEKSKEVIIVVGSSFAARDTRNPFTFVERHSMIKSVFPQDNVKVVPVCDYPYDDNKWVAAVQSAVFSAMRYPPFTLHIGLIGHEKDGTSFYLKIFPAWGNQKVANVEGIDATSIRETIFKHGPYRGVKEFECNLMPEEAVYILDDIIREWVHEDFATLFAEYNMIQKYKESWNAAPYPPTFVTVDAVVVQSGHVLVVKRGDMPGKGLWALPGGFLNQGETMVDGALRELREETKIKVPLPVLRGSIRESKTFDAPNRSQRGRTITQAFFIDLGFSLDMPKVKGSDDAEKAFWLPFNEIIGSRHLFFEDHFHIISYFLKIG